MEGFVHAVVASGNEVSTDEQSGYRHLSRTYQHSIVCHCVGKYVREGTHSNSIEGYQPLLKRQVVGIHHVVSPTHLNRYVNESAWRFNLRDIGEGARVNALLANTSGRLRYNELIA